MHMYVFMENISQTNTQSKKGRLRNKEVTRIFN